MIIKIEDRTDSHIRGLERFLRSGNWIQYPDNPEFHVPTNPITEQDRREVEHAFARILRKVPDKKHEGRFVVTLEVSPYIVEATSGVDIKVPAKFLINLMQSMDTFSEDYERIDLEQL